MQKGGGEGVQIACQIVYVINGRPLSLFVLLVTNLDFIIGNAPCILTISSYDISLLSPSLIGKYITVQI